MTADDLDAKFTINPNLSVTNSVTITGITSGDLDAFLNQSDGTKKISVTIGGIEHVLSNAEVTGTSIDDIVQALNVKLAGAGIASSIPLSNGTWELTVTSKDNTAIDSSIAGIWGTFDYPNTLELTGFTTEDLSNFINNDGTLTFTVADKTHEIRGVDLADGEHNIEALIRTINAVLGDTGSALNFNSGLPSQPYRIVITATNHGEPDTSLVATWKSTSDKTNISDSNLKSGIASDKDRLCDITEFWTSNSVFILDAPQTITITQGNGKSVNVTIYGNDTISDLVTKLNDAIAHGLGQAKYLSCSENNFVTYVEQHHTHDGFESVEGTIVIRSAIAGEKGELYVSANEDLLKALGLNTIQKSTETIFTSDVSDAHTGKTVASNVKLSENKLIGVIHKNIDVEFDPMADTTVTWNENLRGFMLSTDPEIWETTVHITNNSLTLQVGANEGENLALDIGNMSADSLGVSQAIVPNGKAAGRAITIIDQAITKVSRQRSKIGAYQNTLEYIVSNLTTTFTNLTEAESRIRDTDMAQEMMEFIKLQILNQSGTSMLGQANQLPQSVLSLIGS